MDIQMAYTAAKQALQHDIEKLRHNEAEQQEIETILNTFYTQQNNGAVITDYLSPEDYQAILKYVEQVTDTGVNEATLRATPEETWLSQGSIDTTIKPLKLHTTKQGKTTVQKNQVDKVVQRIQQLINSGNASAGFIKRATSVLNELKQIEQLTYNTGSSYVMSSSLVNRLNHLYSQVNTSVLTQKIGDIGEHFAGAVLAAANAKAAGEIEHITVDFLNKLPPSLMVQKGSEASYHYQATYSIEDEGIIATTHATQDKVDMEVVFQGERLNLSVKNYANISNITIFKGNLLSLLSANEHYNKLLRLYSTSTSDWTSSYYLLKKISFVKGLTGGQAALSLKGKEVTTGTADYLVVNHQGKRWYAWSMREIVDQFDTVNKFTPDFPKPGHVKMVEKDKYINSAFQSHISLLTAQLRSHQ